MAHDATLATPAQGVALGSVPPGTVVTIRKSGNLIELSPDSKTPLPEALRRFIEPQLSYIKRIYQPGGYDSITNQRTTWLHQPKQCFRYDKYGRLVCGFGFIYRLVQSLREIGCKLQWVDTDATAARDRPNCYEAHKELVLPHFAFRPRQEEALDSMINNPCGIVHAVTGFGKMIEIAMLALAFPHAKIDIVVPGRDLVAKMNCFLTKYIPSVGQVGDGRKQKGRVTVYTGASLHLADPWDADFLLVDEGHALVADRAAGYLARYQRSRNFTFTASPTGRADGTDIRLESLFGRTAFYLSYPEAVSLGLVVPIHVEWCDVRMDSNPCRNLKNFVTRKRHGIWRNATRNQVIADKVRSFGDDDQVQIITETIEHAVYLRQHLPEFRLVYGDLEMDDRRGYISRGLLPEDEPQMTPQLRDQLRKEFEAGTLKKVVSTKIWSVGIDPTQLAVLVRADADQSEIAGIQAPGRVSRTHAASGKTTGIVVDFSDQFDETLAGKARQRRRYYKNMGWLQT